MCQLQKRERGQRQKTGDRRREETQVGVLRLLMMLLLLLAAAARVAIHIRKIFACINAAARLINHLAKCARGVCRLGVAVPKTPRLPAAGCRLQAAKVLPGGGRRAGPIASSVKRGSYSFANFCSHCWRWSVSTTQLDRPADPPTHRPTDQPTEHASFKCAWETHSFNCIQFVPHTHELPFFFGSDFKLPARLLSNLLWLAANWQHTVSARCRHKTTASSRTRRREDASLIESGRNGMIESWSESDLYD